MPRASRIEGVGRLAGVSMARLVASTMLDMGLMPRNESAMRTRRGDTRDKAGGEAEAVFLHPSSSRVIPLNSDGHSFGSAGAGV